MKLDFKARTVFAGLTWLGFCLFISGCAAAHIYSYRPDKAILIDGNSEKWESAKVYLRSQKVAVAAFNDEKFLYLYLVSWDSGLRNRLFNYGLTVWFDSRGGKHKDLGVHVFGNYSAGKDGSAQVSVLGAGDGVVCPTAEAKIWQVEQDTMCELKMPLIKSEAVPYAVGAKGSGVIGVCFETAKLSLSQYTHRTHPDGDEPSRYSGGHDDSSGPGGHLGGGHGGNGEHHDQSWSSRDTAGFDAPDGLELWLTVGLSN